MMKIAIGADHGGFKLKETIKAELKKHAITVEDVGLSLIHISEPTRPY